MHTTGRPRLTASHAAATLLCAATFAAHATSPERAAPATVAERFTLPVFVPGHGAETPTPSMRVRAPAVAAVLDLRPPAIAGTAAALDPIRSFALRRRAAAADASPEFAGLGTPRVRIVSRAQAFAEGLHHEGIPVARMWENQSALVSLGFNPRGKLGLWLIQKTH